MCETWIGIWSQPELTSYTIPAEVRSYRSDWVKMRRFAYALLTFALLATTMVCIYFLHMDSSTSSSAPSVPAAAPILAKFWKRSAPGGTSGEVQSNYARYKFSTNWFDPEAPQWSLLAREFGGKAGVRVLEIGVFEGRSAIWILENLLTHPTSTLLAIDTFEGSVEFEPEWVNFERTFRRNIAASGREGQVTIMKGRSFDLLVELHYNNSRNGHNQQGQGKAAAATALFDFVYIDASHDADSVLADAILAWPLVKEGGLVVFDDYGLRRYLEEYNDPYSGIDSFIRTPTHAFGLQIMENNYQLTIRKLSPAAGAAQRTYTLRGEKEHDYLKLSRQFYSVHDDTKNSG